MKVTAIIPDDLVNSVRSLSNGSNTTEALIHALNEWVSIKTLEKLSNSIKKNPLKFKSKDVGKKLRSLNRKVT